MISAYYFFCQYVRIYGCNNVCIPIWKLARSAPIAPRSTWCHLMSLNAQGSITSLFMILWPTDLPTNRPKRPTDQTTNRRTYGSITQTRLSKTAWSLISLASTWQLMPLLLLSPTTAHYPSPFSSPPPPFPRIITPVREIACWLLLSQNTTVS